MSFLRKGTKVPKGEQGSEQHGILPVSAPQTLGLRLTAPVITCVTSGRLLHLSVPPFLPM